MRESATIEMNDRLTPEDKVAMLTAWAKLHYTEDTFRVVVEKSGAARCDYYNRNLQAWFIAGRIE